MCTVVDNYRNVKSTELKHFFPDYSLKEIDISWLHKLANLDLHFPHPNSESIYKQLA